MGYILKNTSLVTDNDMTQAKLHTGVLHMNCSRRDLPENLLWYNFWMKKEVLVIVTPGLWSTFNLFDHDVLLLYTKLMLCTPARTKEQWNQYNTFQPRLYQPKQKQSTAPTKFTGPYSTIVPSFLSQSFYLDLYFIIATLILLRQIALRDLL